MLPVICYAAVIFLCAMNVWADWTVELEFFFGLIALGLLLAELGVGPAAPKTRNRRAQ